MLNNVIEITVRLWFLVLFLHGLGFGATQSVSIDSVKGEAAEGRVVAGQRVEFYLRLVYIPGPLDGFVVQSTNAFALYSPDSATWYRGVVVDTFFESFPAHTTFDTTFYGEWIDPQNFGAYTWVHGDALYSDVWVESFSDHDSDPGTGDLFGEGVDSVRYGGSGGPFTGAYGIFYYNGTAWGLLLDSVSTASIGKTVCFDALNSPTPSDYWRWETYREGQYDTLLPSWDGPYCFEIVADCCENLRGNINLDLQDTIDISDLTSMVGWMFRSGAAPPCMLEADVDGNSSHDIADVTYLVGYMFKSGPEPAGCP